MASPHASIDSSWLDIREQIRRSHAEVFSDDSAIPDEVTHYTSFAGLEGIIGKKEIWCTDLREVDDKRECDYGMDVIRRVVTRKSVPKQFFQALLRARSLFGAKNQFTYFISCFCSTQDDPRMWKRYADCGSGFAIVFNGKRLFSDSREGQSYAFTPLIYDEGIQASKTAQIIDRAIQLKRERQLRNRDQQRYWSEEVEFSLLVCGLRFKAPCWQYQQEIRIAVAGSESINPFLYGGTARVAVPFAPQAIVRIVRGPESMGTEKLGQIRDVLNRAGYEDNLPIL